MSTLKAYSDYLNFRNYSSEILSFLFMVIMSSAAIEVKKGIIINDNSTLINGFIDRLMRVKLCCLIIEFCFEYRIPVWFGGNNSARKLLDFSV